MNPEEGNYQVVLIGIEGSTEDKKESFCKKLSENDSISLPLLKKIVDNCPIVLKKNLSLIKAETLGKNLRSFGAIVSVEEKKEVPPIFLEFKDMVPHRVALESSDLQRIQSGEWNLIGRAKNISEENLNDIWVLIQTFNHFGDLLTFEEAPVPFNPIPPGEAFPFRVLFEGSLSIQRVSIAFKNASGYPVPAIDRRKKREWSGVEIRDEKGEELQFIERIKPSEEFSIEGLSDIWEAGAHPSEPESPSLRFEENKKIGEEEEQVTREPILLKPEELLRENLPEPVEESTDLTSGMPRENGYQEKEELRPPLGSGPSPMVMPHFAENGNEEETNFGSKPSLDDQKDMLQETHLETPQLKGGSPLLEEISPKAMKKEKEPFPWIEDFRNSIEIYYQNHPDIFSIWFETYQKEGKFAHPLHSLLTLLVHARFNQANLSEKALENTQRVVQCIAQSNLRLEEIPPLEGIPFFTGEDWRDLFYKAFPKLQEVANHILKREEWNAIDLERLIGVVPHISEKNSRISIRWIHELIPDIVQIDFSNTLISIGEALYRVASRLGVVDPHFDYYQGENSMGDLKIQSFAKAAFPQYPIKIEEPMAWVGRKEEEGYCLPTQPRCEGCLFESFCPRLYFHFNPSVRGMRRQ